MQKRSLGYLGCLGLPGFLDILGWITGNETLYSLYGLFGLYGFSGFFSESR